jgi:hypothetical protein
MPLSVIGAGFGRTGTFTMKTALEQLGFGPCYHMGEVRKNSTAPAYWEAAADGKPVNWERVFEGYRATVDWPACSFYRELADAYPDAKVILTVRDPEAWFNSTQATIFNEEVRRKIQLITAENNPYYTRMVKTIATRQFGTDVHNKDSLIRTFNEHNEEVLRAIPPDRLLVYEVNQGWEPLCTFLQVPVPPSPMPNGNSTDQFVTAIDKMASGETGMEP